MFGTKPFIDALTGVPVRGHLHGLAVCVRLGRVPRSPCEEAVPPDHLVGRRAGESGLAVASEAERPARASDRARRGSSCSRRGEERRRGGLLPGQPRAGRRTGRQIGRARSSHVPLASRAAGVQEDEASS